MNNIENRCEMLDQEIDELKAEILGEFIINEKLSVTLIKCL